MDKKLFSSFSKLFGGDKADSSDSTKGASTEPKETTEAQKVTLDKIAYLSAMHIFRDFTPDEVKTIDNYTVMTTAPKGRIIYSPGETGEVLFLLKKGSVHLYRISSEGRKFLVQTVEPRTFFGEMSLLGQSMADLFAEVAEDCILCVMSRADLERVILEKPQVALRMLEEIGKRLHETQKRLIDSAFKGISARVASLLLNLLKEGTEPIIGIRHQDIADMLGVYRETVTNTLDSFRSEGIIEISRKEIKILNTARLREISEQEVLRKRGSKD
jgi:CRP/FNR family transcriptional regulator, cyclic AMP receptor protein